MTVRLRGRSLRTRLLFFIGVTLAVVCAAMAVTTIFAQHKYLLGSLDDRVANAVARSQGGAALHPELESNLGFLNESGQPAGTLAARLAADGTLLTAQVVTQDAAPQDLTPAQRAALVGIKADGSMHTRTVPGLGTYRITAIGGTADNGVRVLTGLPMDDVQTMIRGLVVVEAAVAVVGLTVAGCVCAVVIRRQLRPLGRVAATAVEVSRAPLGRGVVVGLTRVPERDTDPQSEAGQVGAALNRMIDHVESSLAERQAGEERMRRFLSDASHELRTPLASIAGYAELMNRGTQRIEPTLAWRRVSAESARMTGLVEDLLLLARLDEGRPLQSDEVDLAAVVAESVWDARAAGRTTTGSWRCSSTPRRWSSATRPGCTRWWPTCWPTHGSTHRPARRWWPRRRSWTSGASSGYATTARASRRTCSRPSSNASPERTSPAPAAAPRTAARASASPSCRPSWPPTEAPSTSKAPRDTPSSRSNCPPREWRRWRRRALNSGHPCGGDRVRTAEAPPGTGATSASPVDDRRRSGTPAPALNSRSRPPRSTPVPELLPELPPSASGFARAASFRVRSMCVRRLQRHRAALASREGEVGALPHRADRNP